MARPNASDLIFNKDGSVYHLSLKPKDISDVIFTVGDPGRVHRVSSQFDSIDFEMNKREFITHTGMLNGKKVTVMSTGMGTANIEILMLELDLLANYDFKKSKFKSKKKSLNIIRLGTSGSMQSGLTVGSILLSESAVGLDNLMEFYLYEESKNQKAFSEEVKNHLDLNLNPYTADADLELLEKYNHESFVKGVTVTCPGFYGPQGREINLQIRDPKLLEKLSYFNSQDKWLTNFEMETSAYYAFAQMLGHKALSVNAILANRVTGRFSSNPNRIVDRMIRLVLEKF